LAESSRVTGWPEVQGLGRSTDHAIPARLAIVASAAFEAMRDLLGDVHEVRFVLVQAVDGDSYGYGGRTQKVRRAERRPG
jgi:4-oxalocrotonate tautomerase